MYLLNISSNVNAKFYIGSALTRLNELSDMLVSSVYVSKDRKRSEFDYANCVVCLHTSETLEALTKRTKELEAILGRGSIKVAKNQVVVDIDILAQSTAKDQNEDSACWRFVQKRLPLPDEVLWGLSEIKQEARVELPSTAETKPKLADWQF